MLAQRQKRKAEKGVRTEKYYKVSDAENTGNVAIGSESQGDKINHAQLQTVMITFVSPRLVLIRLQLNPPYDYSQYFYKICQLWQEPDYIIFRCFDY